MKSNLFSIGTQKHRVKCSSFKRTVEKFKSSIDLFSPCSASFVFCSTGSPAISHGENLVIIEIHGIEFSRYVRD